MQRITLAEKICQQKNKTMKQNILLIFITSVLFSCQNNVGEKQAKSLSGLTQMKETTKTPSCFTKNKADFRELLEAMLTKRYSVLKLSEWPLVYKNHIEDGWFNGTERFIELPENTKWTGVEHGIKKPEQAITFTNALITETVLKGYDSDVKIVQFLFKNSMDAEKAIAKMKLISAYTISTDGLKNPNYYFINDCVIYFIRVRAAAFPTETFKEIFEKKYGKVETLRW